MILLSFLLQLNKRMSIILNILISPSIWYLKLIPLKTHFFSKTHKGFLPCEWIHINGETINIAQEIVTSRKQEPYHFTIMTLFYKNTTFIFYSELIYWYFRYTPLCYHLSSERQQSCNFSNLSVLFFKFNMWFKKYCYLQSNCLFIDLR